MAVSLFNRAEISFTGKEKKATVYSSLLLLYTPLSKEKRYAFFSISIPLQQVEFNRASFSVFSKKPFSFSSVASNYRYDYLLALHRERERKRKRIIFSANASFFASIKRETETENRT